MFRYFESLIDPFKSHDDSMPPATLLGFYWRYCRQIWPFLLILMAIGLVVSLIEIAMLRYIGSIVDLLKTTTPSEILADYGPTFLWMGFVIVIARAIQLGLDPAHLPARVEGILDPTHQSRLHLQYAGDVRPASCGEVLIMLIARRRGIIARHFPASGPSKPPRIGRSGLLKVEDLHSGARLACNLVP